MFESCVNFAVRFVDIMFKRNMYKEVGYRSPRGHCLLDDPANSAMIYMCIYIYIYIHTYIHAYIHI